MSRRGLLAAVGGLVLVELGFWIWGLWPLPDPRFDWPRYFDKAVATQDCESAVWIAANAIQFHDQPGLDAARLVASAKWCPLGAKTFHDRRMLDEDLPWQIAHPKDPYVWAPGWRGRWNALPWILRGETVAAFANARRKDGWLLAALELPIQMPWHLRCRFALTEQPMMAYYAMRRRLATAYPELKLDDWDRRAQSCLEVSGRL